MPAFETKKKKHGLDRFRGNGPYGKIPTTKEPIRTLGFTLPYNNGAYYMVSSVSGQDEPNRALWLASRAREMWLSYQLGATAKELGQYPAIWTSHLVNNAYIIATNLKPDLPAEPFAQRSGLLLFLLSLWKLPGSQWRSIWKWREVCRPEAPFELIYFACALASFRRFFHEVCLYAFFIIEK